MRRRTWPSRPARTPDGIDPGPVPRPDAHRRRPARPTRSTCRSARERDELARELDVARKRIFELEMSQLRRARDAQTGILRTEPFGEQLVEKLARAQRHGLQGAVVVVQVDRLADIHREHGFVAGDQLLRALVAGLRAGTRADDRIVRTGETASRCCRETGPRSARSWPSVR